ncbi:unnamed protein product [Malus baccata var. baccata]
MVVYGIEEKYKERAERTVNVAMWCVQYKQDDRPSCWYMVQPMINVLDYSSKQVSVVVKMLEGAVEIPRPSTNPFQHLMSDTSTRSDFCSVPSQTVNGYRAVDDTPIMKKYEIEIVSN